MRSREGGEAGRCEIPTLRKPHNEPALSENRIVPKTALLREESALEESETGRARLKAVPIRAPLRACANNVSDPWHNSKTKF